MQPRKTVSTWMLLVLMALVMWSMVALVSLGQGWMSLMILTFLGMVLTLYSPALAPHAQDVGCIPDGTTILCISNKSNC